MKSNEPGQPSARWEAKVRRLSDQILRTLFITRPQELLLTKHDFGAGRVDDDVRHGSHQ